IVTKPVSGGQIHPSTYLSVYMFFKFSDNSHPTIIPYRQNIALYRYLMYVPFSFYPRYIHLGHLGIKTIKMQKSYLQLKIIF
ncbi:MAG TPA: hypothetical protein VN040_08355, partial [Pseudosphingobacterium sp.]|nr:hypothetical protein [Pseudosphingobacterium sp.]